MPSTMPELPDVLYRNPGSLAGWFETLRVPGSSMQGSLPVAPSWEDVRRLERASHLPPKNLFRFFGQMHHAGLTVLRAWDRNDAEPQVHLILAQSKLIALAHSGENRQPE